MTDDVYRRLAQRLDNLPNGFPTTDDGVEIKILEKIFSPEDAETALLLKAYPQDAATIAERLGRPVPEMESTLNSMAEKGQIGCITWGGRRSYLLMPFVVGIYEFQMYRIDVELADLFERYWPTLQLSMGSFAPAMGRVVPINAPLDNKGEILVYEDVRRMLDNAKSYRLHECICRKERRLTGHMCEQPLEVCLSISPKPSTSDDFSLGGREITKEEALAVLADAEKRGLVHNTFYNTQTGHFGLCNCCPCCCGLLRGVKNFGVPHLLAKSNYFAEIDAASCTGCGICAAERCPVDAIVEDNGVFRVTTERCIGCGLCTSTCPAESIRLLPRPESKCELPPKNLMEWYYLRAQSRGIDLKLD